MAVRKTHVKSDKRIKREKEKREEAASRAKQQKSKKKSLGSKKKTVIDTRFTFKSQSQRFKEVTVDLASLLDEAVDRYSRWTVQNEEDIPLGNEEDLGNFGGEQYDAEQNEDDAENEEDEDMITNPMSVALAELSLLNTTRAFQTLHKTLYPQTRSLPLIIHHRQQISNSLVQALTQDSYLDVALCAPQVIDLIPSFLLSLWPDTEFKLLDISNIVTPIITALVSLAVNPPSIQGHVNGDRGNDPHSPVEISKRAFQVIAWTFRLIGTDFLNGESIADRAQIAWEWVRDALEGKKSVVHFAQEQHLVQQISEEPGHTDNAEETEDLLDLNGLETVYGQSNGDTDGIAPQTFPSHNGDLQTLNEAASDAGGSSAKAGSVDEGEAEEVTEDMHEDASGDAIKERSKSASKPHLRRLLATSFAYLLRRSKGTISLDAVVQVILKDLTTRQSPELCEAASWLFLESIKSVDSHLHSRGVPILRCLIQEAIALESQVVAEVVSATLTGVTHYATINTFAPIAEMVTDRFQAITGGVTSSFERTLVQDLVSVIVGTRKATRLSDKAKSQLIRIAAEQTETIQSAGVDIHCIQMTFLLLLYAPTLQDMLSNGRKLLEAIWNMPSSHWSLSYAFFNTLAHKKWAYFKDFALLVLANPKAERHADPRYTRLLANLSEDGYSPAILEGPIMQAALVKQLKEWRTCAKNGKLTDRQTSQLFDTLRLFNGQELPLRIAEEVEESLVTAVHIHHTEQQARAEFQSTGTNIALVIASCLSTIYAQNRAAFVTDDTFMRILRLFSWHRSVVAALVAGIDRGWLPTTDMVQVLQQQSAAVVLQEDTELKSNYLRLMAIGKNEDSVIVQILRTEEIPLTAHAARDKTMHLRRLCQRLQSPGVTPVEVDLALIYIFAALKVNFRPLWAEAISCLSSLNDNQDKLVASLLWSTLLDQLRSVQENVQDDRLAQVPNWPTIGRPSDAKGHPPSWRQEELVCTAYARQQGELWNAYVAFTEQCEVWSRPPASRFIENQIADSRISYIKYEEQLLVLSKALSPLIERHSREFLQLFFEQFGDAENKSGEHSGGRAGRERLCKWLGVFSTFKNPKALYRAQDLYHALLGFLSHGDQGLQTVALDSIMKWKDPALLRQQDNLRGLLQSSSLRETLLRFSLASSAEEIPLEHRAQVIDVTIRILFGLMSSRQGRSSGQAAQRSQSIAILTTLKACSAAELETLVDLMLQPFAKIDTDIDAGFHYTDDITISDNRQLGFLNLLGDVLEHLYEQVSSQAGRLLYVVLNIAYQARPTPGSGERSRQIRQLAFRRIADFFRQGIRVDHQKILPSLFSGLISPRLENFGAENAQGPSAILKLLSTWATSPHTVHYLVDYDSETFPAVFTILSTPQVKDTAIICVLDMLSDILRLVDSDTSARERLLLPYLDNFLQNATSLLRSRASSLNHHDQVGTRLISIMVGLEATSMDGQHLQAMLPILIALLSKPNNSISERIKTDLLVIVRRLLEHDADTHNLKGSTTLQDCYRIICSLFTVLRTRAARLENLAVFQQLQDVIGAPNDMVKLLSALNSFSARRMEEPDFEVRLSAYNRLNEVDYKTISASDWIPLLANMFYFIQDTDELSIRSSASATLSRFVEVAATSLDSAYRSVFTQHFYPALKRCLRSRQEVVRSEGLSVLHAAVQLSTGVAEIDDMKCLLAHGDTEADFFNNILHIQNHRRSRALRRLAEEAEAGHLTSKNLSEIFMPLIAQNLESGGVSKAQDLVNETITTMGRLSSFVTWSAYNRLVSQLYTLASNAREQQKVRVRTLVAVLKGFNLSAHATSSKDITRVCHIVNGKLLPKLFQFLQGRDSADETMRIPIAEGIASILKQLPAEETSNEASNLVTAIAQILRSRSQEVRDLARATLVNICATVGFEQLPVFLRDLRTSLAKGPHLHVLAYVLHSLLERMSVTPDVRMPEAALADALEIAYDDLFGRPAKDRMSQDFRSKTKFREVRLCKSMHSIEIMATLCSPACLSLLLGPLRKVMQNSLNLRTAQTLEDVLRRMAAALLGNTQFDNFTMLTLCQALISQNSDFLAERPARKVTSKSRDKEYQVQLKRDTSASIDGYKLNSHHFVAFGLDLINGAFRKNRFDLQDAEIVSRLEPLVNTIGDTLFTENAIILDRALRAIASLLKCPLESTDKAAPVLAKQMINIVEDFGGSSSDLAQTAIRSLASLIRDRKSLVLSEEQLSVLVSIITPDLEEPDQQAALFALLRAIISRKFASPEVYDLLDRVAEIVVTSQSHGTREICRSIYLQFLLDYPQGKRRLSTALQYLAKNIGGYVHETGRISALELVHAILTKFGPDLVEQYAEMFHVALVMVLANDESPKCRSMAAEGCKALYLKISASGRAKLVDTILSWSTAVSQAQLQCVSAQLAGIIVESVYPGSQAELLISQLMPRLCEIVEREAILISTPDHPIDIEETAEETASLSWRLSYHALSSVSRILNLVPKAMSEIDASFQSSVRSLLLFPHTWVRQAASRLVAFVFLADSSNRDVANLLEFASAFCMQLRSKHLTDQFSLQIVKNLFTVGKMLCTVENEAHGSVNGASDDHSDAESNADEMDGSGAHRLDGSKPFDRANQSDPFHWLYVKLSHQARTAHQKRPSKYLGKPTDAKWSTQPAAILRWFAAMVTEPAIPTEQLSRQLHQMLLPIVRIIEDPNGSQDPQLDELQALAREVQELISSRVGSSAAIEAYSAIQRKMTMKREERKRNNAMRTVTDPEVEAMRRAKKNESKLKNRKRKNESFRDNKVRNGPYNGRKRYRPE